MKAVVFNGRFALPQAFMPRTADSTEAEDILCAGVDWFSLPSTPVDEMEVDSGRYDPRSGNGFRGHFSGDEHAGVGRVLS